MIVPMTAMENRNSRHTLSYSLATVSFYSINYSNVRVSANNNCNNTYISVFVQPSSAMPIIGGDARGD